MQLRESPARDASSRQRSIQGTRTRRYPLAASTDVTTIFARRNYRNFFFCKKLTQFSQSARGSHTTVRFPGKIESKRYTEEKPKGQYSEVEGRRSKVRGNCVARFDPMCEL
jgi:hypothetical protein